MINKYFNYIVIGLLVILVLQNLLSDTVSTEDNKIYRDKIQELNNQKLNLLFKLDTLKKVYGITQENITTDSVFIWDADRSERDRIRAAINPR